MLNQGIVTAVAYFFNDMAVKYITDNSDLRYYKFKNDFTKNWQGANIASKKKSRIINKT